MEKVKEIAGYILWGLLAAAMTAAMCAALTIGIGHVDAASVKFSPSTYGFNIQLLNSNGEAILAGVRTSVDVTSPDTSGDIIYGVGDFAWPVPGYYSLSSLFGNRIHPITGKANYHTGIDIPCPLDTPIQAARGGEVIVSGWDNSYGNYVKLKHSNGMCTLYAHMHTRACTVGQYVTTGQVIGYVDSTGSSTGNHLHFEIHKDTNWNRTDPVPFYPDILSAYL